MRNGQQIVIKYCGKNCSQAKCANAKSANIKGCRSCGGDLCNSAFGLMQTNTLTVGSFLLLIYAILSKT
uniref:Uncharacterized protein n=1 Tax=Globodera pallida TaxID=36090 RepID=A0A183CA56_GLOPA